MNYHYVCVTNIREDFIEIIDPEVGHLSISNEEFEEDFSGFALLLVRNNTEVTNSRKIKLPKIIKNHLLENQMKVASLLLVSAFAYISQLAQPILVQKFFDSDLLLKQYNLVIPLSLFTLLIFICFGISKIRQIILFKISADLDKKITSDFFSYFLNDLNISQNNQNQGLFQTQLNEINFIQTFLLEDITDLIFNSFSFLFYTTLLFTYDTKLGLLTSCILLFYFFGMKKYSYIIENLTRKSIYYYSKASNLLIELFTHKKEILLLNASVNSLEKWRFNDNKSLAVELEEDNILDFFSFYSTIYTEYSKYIIFVSSLYLLYQGNLSIGQIIAVYFITNELFEPLNEITGKWDDIKKFEVACENIDELLESKDTHIKNLKIIISLNKWL